MKDSFVDQLVVERCESYSQIVQILTKYNDITNSFSSQVVKLSNFKEKFEKNIESIKNHDGILRIGVVGQVKAGKSSFINALLFDGKNILPKASTPMTAALTLMSYSDKLCAEVEFYTKEDWNVIKAKAKEYKDKIAEVTAELNNHNISNKLKNFVKGKVSVNETEIIEEAESQLSSEVISANELFEQANKNKLNTDNFLGKPHTIDDIDTIEDLMDKLCEYVGADGKYTPFTRNTKIYLNIPALQGIELVDTPGFNDPIISRGMITRDYLAKCDCVFLLSYSGQFAGEEDTSFLINTLPNEGIRNITLVGSKFDSVLLDVAPKYNGDLITAMRETRDDLEKQADSTILPQITNNSELPLMSALKESLPPIFISGLCYSIAAKNLTNLDSTESHILQQLSKRFPDFEFNQDILFQLANIDKIRDENLATIIEAKNEILENRLKDIIDGQNRKFTEEIGSLRAALKNQLDKLKTANIEELQKQYEETMKALKKGENDIAQEFFEMQLHIKKELNEVTRKLKSAKTGSKRLNKEEHNEVVGSERYGFLWLKKRDVWGIVTYANVYDAIDSITRYTKKTNELIIQKWETLIDLDKLERNILLIVTNCLDTSSEYYDKNNIIRPLKNAISEIMIEPYDVDSSQYEKTIMSNFSGTTVKGYDTDRLQILLIDTIDEIFNEICTEVENQKGRLVSTLKDKGKKFVTTISSNAKKEQEELKEQIKQQKYYVKRYEALLNDLSGYI